MVGNECLPIIMAVHGDEVHGFRPAIENMVDVSDFLVVSRVESVEADTAVIVCRFVPRRPHVFRKRFQAVGAVSGRSVIERAVQIADHEDGRLLFPDKLFYLGDNQLRCLTPRFNVEDLVSLGIRDFRVMGKMRVEEIYYLSIGLDLQFSPYAAADLPPGSAERIMDRLPGVFFIVIEYAGIKFLETRLPEHDAVRREMVL